VTHDELAGMIDHAQLKAYATQADIDQLCREAVEFGFRNVCVNPAWTTYCAKQLAGTPVGICPVVGFPLGANTARIKVEEAREAVKNGASELDMVLNIGALRSGFVEFVQREIAAVVQAVRGVPVKVILETSFLDDSQKIKGCTAAMDAGAAYVKTSTGYGRTGASLEDVALMRQTVGDRMGIKAAGGIRSFATAQALIEAGATRLGTSAGARILHELNAA
jgi:deoxyribose-phosphate aldolase